MFRARGAADPHRVQRQAMRSPARPASVPTLPPRPRARRLLAGVAVTVVLVETGWLAYPWLRTHVLSLEETPAGRPLQLVLVDVPPRRFTPTFSALQIQTIPVVVHPILMADHRAFD